MCIRQGVCGLYRTADSERLTLIPDYPIPTDEVGIVAQSLAAYSFLTQAHLPQSELDHLDLQHHLLTMLFGGKLHLAPLKDLERFSTSAAALVSGQSTRHINTQMQQ